MVAGRREQTTRGAVRLAAGDHLLRPLIRHAAESPARPLLTRRAAEAQVDIPASDVWQRVRALARSLIGRGIGIGDRVAIVGDSGPGWLLVDLAVLAAGGVTVPLPTNSPPERTAWVLSDAGVAAVALGRGATAETRDLSAAAATVRGRLVDLDDLDTLAADADGVAEAELDRRLDGLGLDTLATILYTSGTTGRSKGCRLTHGNLRSNAANIAAALADRLGEDETLLANVPLAFSNGRMLAFLALEHGMRLAFASTAETPREAVLVRPTLAEVGTVMTVIRELRDAEESTEGWGSVAAALRVAARHSLEQAEHGHASLPTATVHTAFAPARERLRAALGGRLHTCLSAGGPDDAAWVHALRGIGIEVYAGYGMSEASPVLTMNRPAARRIGTSGQPLPGTTIRIAADGEILARGPQVFHGYLSNPDATRTALGNDGWLHTGDLGSLDADGYLTVEVRKSEIITLTSGATVVPSSVETRLERHPAIHRAVVFGHDRPHLVALIVPASAVGSTERGDEEPRELEKMVDDAVATANYAAPTHERVDATRLLDRDLAVSSGELTPTGKLRRPEIAARHADLLAAMSGG